MVPIPHAGGRPKSIPANLEKAIVSMMTALLRQLKPLLGVVHYLCLQLFLWFMHLGVATLLTRRLKQAGVALHNGFVVL